MLYRDAVIITSNVSFQVDLVIPNQRNQQDFHKSVSNTISHAPSRANTKATKAFAHVRCFIVKTSGIENVGVAPTSLSLFTALLSTDTSNWKKRTKKMKISHSRLAKGPKMVIFGITQVFYTYTRRAVEITNHHGT